MSDYNLLVSFSDDLMEGYVSIIPKGEHRIPIENVRELTKRIKDSGIIYGLEDELINKMAEDYNSGKEIKNYLVAKGKPVEEGVNGTVEFKIDLTSQPKIEDNKIDYKEIDKFKTIEKGELIAVKRKAIKGKRGITVTGLGKEAKEVESALLMAGKNVRTEESENEVYYYADETGVILYQKNSIAVHPILTITGDVDYSIGNLHYNGDIKIMGDVLPDFKVEASGKIIIMGTAIACIIKSDSDVIIKGGFAGKDKGKLFAKGDVDIGYVERGYIESFGDVYVKGGVLDSEILCNGTFFGELQTVKVMESKIKAGNGIHLYIAGSNLSKNVTLSTGFDLKKELELEKQTVVLNEYIKEFSELKKKYGGENLEEMNINPFQSSGHNIEQVKNNFKRYHELKQLIQQLHSEIKQFEQEVFKTNATIKIKKTIYAGAIITISDISKTVEKELHNVIFYLDKEENEIKWTIDTLR
jgi:uncharacterized protein (DUF342 family)